MGDLTKNFSRKEFACKCGCGFDDINIGLVNRLQVIRDIIQVPIIINSGCRCKTHNKFIGGASISFHLIGDAADWCFPLSTSENRYFGAVIMFRNWSGGFHYYKDKRFFHVDVGKKRRW